jgi:hypothetical protein
MHLTVNKTYKLSDILQYLGTETSALNQGLYRSCPAVLKLVTDNKVQSFVEIGTDDSCVSELLALIYKDINVTCITEDHHHVVLDDEVDGLQTIISTSEDACDMFDDNSLDMVYFDEHDTYDSVLRNFDLWSPKVRSGGIIAGYEPRLGLTTGTSKVELAIDNYMITNNHVLNNTDENSNVYWFTV